MSDRGAGEGGWTLVEAMVVVAIIAIAMAVGLPQMGTILADGRVRSAAQALQDGLAIAQAEALRRSTNVELVVTGDDPSTAAATIAALATSWSVRVPADSTRGIAAPLFVRGFMGDPNQSAASIENRSGAVGIVFGPSGRVSIDAGAGYVPTTGNVSFRITAANADRPLCVYATMAGSVKVCDPALANTDPRSCTSTVATYVDCPAAGS